MFGRRNDAFGRSQVVESGFVWEEQTVEDAEPDGDGFGEGVGHGFAAARGVDYDASTSSPKKGEIDVLALYIF